MSTVFAPFPERWKNDDTLWMTERKKIWKYIKQYLDLDINLSKKDQNHYREFFLTGQWTKPHSRKEGEFAEMEVSYQLLLTPMENQSEADNLVNSLSDWRRRLVRNGIYHALAAYVEHDYGWFNGKEKYLIRALFPNQYSNATITHKNAHSPDFPEPGFL